MEQTSEDQKITVHVWLYSTVDKEAARRQAMKECGYIGGLPLNMTLNEVYAYKAAYNRIISEQEAAVTNSFVEKLGISEEDIVYLGKSPYVIANLTKAQINEAAAYAEVESLSYVEDVAVEPSTGNTKISGTLQQIMKGCHITLLSATAPLTCVLTLIIVSLQIGFQRIAFCKMSIANQKSRIAFCKTRIANLKEGLQNSKGVCKRVVMSSFWDTCNRNPPLGFVSPNGGYVSCSPIIYITISSFDFKYMTSVITQILYLSFVNFNLHMIIDIHK